MDSSKSLSILPSQQQGFANKLSHRQATVPCLGTEFPNSCGFPRPCSAFPLPFSFTVVCSHLVAEEEQSKCEEMQHCNRHPGAKAL